MTLFKTRADQTSRNARALSTEHLMADLGKRTASGGMIAVAAQGVKMVLQLTQAAILARLLAPEDFGIMAMAMTVTGFVSIFTDLGLSAATVQRKEIDQDTVSALFFLNIAMGLVVMLVCAAVAPAAAWFFGDPRVTWVVIGLAATIPLGAASAQHSALLTRGMRWVTIQWTGIFTQMIGMLVAVLLAWKTDLGYWALVASGWVTAIIGVALAWIVCPWRPSWVRNWQGAKSALNFGAYLTGFNVVNYFHRQLDNVFVGWRWGSADLGLYSRAYTLFMMPLTAVVWPMGSSVVPAMCRVQSDPVRFRAIYGGALSLGMWAGCVAASGAYIFAEPVIGLIYGASWLEAVPIFKALAISILIQPLYSSVGWIAIAMGLTKRKFQSGVVAAVIYAIAFRIGVEYGAVGVAYSYSAALLVIVPVWILMLTRGSPISLRFIIRIIAGPLATGIFAIAIVKLLLPEGSGFPFLASSALLLATIAVAGYYFTTFRTQWCVLGKIPMIRSKQA